MRQFVRLTALLLAWPTLTFAADGTIDVVSNHPVAETTDRLERVLTEARVKIFARVPHSEGARSVGVELPPTVLLIFGNPRAGAPLIACARTVGIDLPQKALIWEDTDGTVRITYNDPSYLKQRHAIDGCEPVLEKMTGALGKFTATAAE